MKLMPKTACYISYAHDAKGRLVSAVPVYHNYLQDHLENPGHSMIHGVNIRQISRITGVSFGVIHRAKRGSENRSQIHFSLIYLAFIILSLLALSCSNGKTPKGIVEVNLDSTLINAVVSEDTAIFYTNESEDISDKELKTYTQYQTFDEYKLEGVGKVYHSPYVYVKEIDDTIIVRVSNNKNHSIRYVRKNGVWQSYQELDVEKRGMPISKSSREKPARSYYRIFKGDSIIELSSMLDTENSSQDVYIKNRKGCVLIALEEREHINDVKHPYNEIMNIVSDYKSGKLETLIPTYRIFKYSLTQNDKYYYYVCAIRDTHGREHHLDTVVIRKTSLQEFGIGPGLFENMFLKEEEIGDGPE